MALSGTQNVQRRRASLQTALYHARVKNAVAKKSAPVADLSANASGSITFASNPANASTITLGGAVVTFGTNVAIGGSLAVTLASLLAFLNASADANVKKCAYTIAANSLGVRSKTTGPSTFTLAASAATISHSPLVLPTITKRAKL